MLKIYLGLREDELESKFLYTKHLISSLKKLFPISFKLETKLIDFINNEVAKPFNISTKSVCFGLDIGKLWPSSITFDLTINYKLAKSAEYSQIIKLNYKEFDANYGIIQTSNGFIIILLNYKIPKFVNLKYSVMPTKLEFRILLDVVIANIKDRNFEEVIFKDEIKYIDETQYNKGPKNLDNSCFVNSAIQCILKIPHIKLFFQTCSRIDSLQFDKSCYPLLYTIHQNLQPRFNKIEHNEVWSFVQDMREYVPMDKNNSLHDVNEFLQSLLETLDKELMYCFSLCKILYNTSCEEEIDPVNSYLKSSSYSFKGLFLGIVSNTITCDFCNYEENINFPITTLNLNIPEKKLELFNIKILPYDTNRSQFTYNLQVAINSNLSLWELKYDISELISIPIQRLIVAREFSFDKCCKVLRVIEYEGESIETLVSLSSDLYFFELPEHYTKEGWVFLFVSQGIGQNNNFFQFGYSLCLIPIVDDLKFEYFCECLISDIERVSNFRISSLDKKERMQKSYITRKIRKLNFEHSIYIDENIKTPNLKEAEDIPCNKKIFEIFKLNWLNYNKNDKIVFKIQNESEFNTVKPYFNGDNVFIKWSKHYITRIYYPFLNHKEPPYSNTKGLEYFKYFLNFISAPLTSLTYTPLTYIDYAKDLFNGNEYKNQRIEHETSLDDCIKDYLKTTYLKPQENSILNWECESCNGNYGQKREQISSFPPYLIINLNRFKSNDDSVNTEKNSKLVKFPFEIQFKNNGKWLNYSLVSVCNQFGVLDGVHYTATCKNTSNDKWYNYKDAFVKSVDENDIFSLNSYILIYQSSSAFISNDPLNLEELPLKTKQLCKIKY